ncbi:MAG: polyprenyl diphosphate synthase [Christensenellales bacterium]|jgi:di-trans,poly-cis-decaprenylcistransferase
MSAIPCHVAFIMDGNGRWAVKRGLSRLKGHREGIKKAELVIDYCLRRGIKVVSLFVFSTENWKRAEREVAGLFKLASRYLDNIADFSKRGIRVVVSGDLSRLPEELVLKINKAETATVSNRVMTLNLCINYGGRAELTHAVNEIIRSGKNSVSEKELGEFMYQNLPDPDLIVRTGGQMRLSNFLLFQSAYSELVFSDTLWPDIGEKELDGFLNIYQHRNRNFGEVRDTGKTVDG